MNGDAINCPMALIETRNPISKCDAPNDPAKKGRRGRRSENPSISTNTFYFQSFSFFLKLYNCYKD